MAGAKRASATCARASVDRSFPHVPAFALPSDLLPGVRADVLRAKLVSAVPLGSEIGAESREIGDAGQSALAGAVGATRAFCAIGYRCLPAVTALTGPPDSSTSSGADRVGLDPAVSLVVPVRCEVRAHGSEIGLTWDGTATGVVGATRAESCAIRDRCHPLVPLPALPIDSASRSCADVIGVACIDARGVIPFGREVGEGSAEVG